jgi:hypothetical protein
VGARELELNVLASKNNKKYLSPNIDYIYTLCNRFFSSYTKTYFEKWHPREFFRPKICL